jgi:hypothetical protein
MPVIDGGAATFNCNHCGPQTFFDTSGVHIRSCWEAGAGGAVALRTGSHEAIKNCLAGLVKRYHPTGERVGVHVEPRLADFGYKAVNGADKKQGWVQDRRADIIIGAASTPLDNIVIDTVVSLRLEEAVKTKSTKYAVWDIPDKKFVPFAVSAWGKHSQVAAQFLQRLVKAHVGDVEDAQGKAMYGHILRTVRERLSVRLMAALGHALVRCRSIALSSVRTAAVVPMGEGDMYIARLKHTGVAVPAPAQAGAGEG